MLDIEETQEGQPAGDGGSDEGSVDPGSETPDEGQGAPPAAQPATAPAPTQNWWESPQAQAALAQARMEGYTNARSEQEIEAERIRLESMDDAEYGRELREKQRQMAEVGKTREEIAKALAGKVWSDLTSNADFRELPPEKQREIFYSPKGGNPYTAAVEAIAEHKAEKLVQQRQASLSEAERNLQTAAVAAGAPVGGAATSPAGDGPNNWGDYFAAKDRERGFNRFAS